MTRNAIRRTLLAVAALALCTSAVWSQADTTRLDGRITNAGKSLVGVQVIFSQLDTLNVYRATTDKYGTISILDVPRGTYVVSVLNAAGDKLFRKTLDLTSAPDAPIRLDLEISGAPAAPVPSASSPAPAAAPSPESAREAEIDAQIRRYESAVRAGDHQTEIAALKAIVAADPARWDYFESLGNAQFSLGDFENAAQSFDKGIQAAQQFLSNTASDRSVITKSDRDRARAGMSQMLLNQGNAFLKLKKNDEAISAYTRSAESAANPAAAYFNLCIIHYNARDVARAVDACDKTTAADPGKAEAYFLKGAMLFTEAKPDKNGKVTAPPGTSEALHKYLELAPQGSYASNAKQMLEYIGAKPAAPEKSVKKP